MPQPAFYDPQGNEIPEEELAARFQAGEVQAAPDAQVTLYRGEQRVQLPAAEAGKLFREGWAIEPPSVTVQKEEAERYESLPHQVGAFAGGAASSLTLGGTDALARELAPDLADTMAKQRAYNPGSAMLGEAAGAIAPILATGGAAALPTAGKAVAGAGLKQGLKQGLKTALTHSPQGALVRGAAKAGQATERALGGGLVGKAGGYAVEGGIDATVSTMGANVAQAALEDEELVGERLLAGVQPNALLGSGIAGILPVGAAGIGAAGRKLRTTAGHVAPTAAKAADSLLDATYSTFGDGYAALASKFSASSKADIARVMSSPDVGLRQMNKRVFRDELASKSADDLGQVLKLKDITKQIERELPEDLIQQKVKRGSMGRIAAQVDELRAANAPVLADPKTLRKELREAERELKRPSAIRDDRSEAQRIIDDAGGVLQGDYARDGMRSGDHVRAAYEGATPDQVRAIAEGRRNVQPSDWGRDRPLDPIRVAVETDDAGKHFVGLVDGRHRAMVAHEMGADKIRATVARKKKVNGQWVDLGETEELVSLRSLVGNDGPSKVAQKLAKELQSTPDFAQEMLDKWARAPQNELDGWAAKMRGSKSLDNIRETVLDYRTKANAPPPPIPISARIRQREAKRALKAQEKLKEQYGSSLSTLRKIGSEADGRLARAIDSGDEASAFQALVTNKRDYDAFLERTAKARPSRQAQADQLAAARQFAEAQSEALAKQIGDAESFGEAAGIYATRQRQLTDIAATGDDFRAVMGSRPERAKDSLQRLYSEIQPESDEIARALRHLDEEERLAKSLLDGGGISAAQRKQYEQGLEAIKRLRTNLQTHAPQAADVNVLDRMIEAEETQDIGRMLGVNVGANVIAGGVGYALGGEAGAAAAVGFNALRKPGMLARQVATISDLARRADKVKSRVKNAVSAHLGQAQSTKATPEIRRQLGSKATGVSSALIAWGANAKERRETYEKKAAEVRRVAQLNPADRAMWASQTMTRGLDDAAPGVVRVIMQRHQQAIDFIHGKLPPLNTSSNPLQPHLAKEMPLSDGEINAMARFFEAVENPLSVIDDWENGNLTNEGVEVLKNVYPRFYEDFRETVVLELSKTTKTIPYEEQMDLQLKLDIGVPSPFLTADFQDAQKQRRERFGVNPEAPGGAPDTAQFAQTQTEKIATRL